MHPYFDSGLIDDISDFSQYFNGTDLLKPNFSLSIKSTWRNPCGVEEEILLFGQVLWPQSQIPPAENWAVLRLRDLNAILNQPEFDPQNLLACLEDMRLFNRSPIPTPYALLHAAIPEKYGCFDEPVSILSASCLENAPQQLKEWYQEKAAVISFDPNLHRLSRSIKEQGSISSKLILLNRGILLGADDQKLVYHELKQLESIAANQIFPQVPSSFQSDAHPSGSDILPRIRAEISAQRGRPLVLHVDHSAEIHGLIQSPLCGQITEEGLPFPGFSAYTARPAFQPAEDEAISMLSPESKAGTTIVLHPELGCISAADSPAEARQNFAYFALAAQALKYTRNPDRIQYPDPQQLEQAQEWEVVHKPAALPFTGEVALVTGAASGIGKAIVDSLLKRGSTVVGLDINPSIETTFHDPCYKGRICDVFDEAVICDTMRQIALEFGGLDILVLNAGLFPGGCYIEKLTLTEFTRVININFVANMVIMREAFPLLRLAPKYGRVVIIGSKNMRAPGPGAAAYSTSKAALTQLARVAALEWGSERIRVNVIHPDAVFDTALYTEEVLQARAAHYGMTVDQYKKRNLLKTEITSHDVAELTAEMCGPLFRHMTGGQIQIDGGNDRTI